MGQELEYVFHPRSVAVVGASPEARSQGNRYVALLQEHGYPGAVYPVHPTAEEILGLTAYRSVLDAPGPVDYVISSIPARGVLELIDQCAAKGVRTLQFFTARFSETGNPELAELERELLRRARVAGIRVIGPNCMGIYYPEGGMAFKGSMPQESGGVGVLSQSGGNSLELVMEASVRGVRFSKVVSYGNALDLNEADFMDYFAEDPSTKVVAAYIEGVKDGRRFFEALRKAAATKPVVVMKGGRTGAGDRAVASHTASLAGAAELWDALAKQTGALLVDSMDALVDLLVAFTFCRPATGTRVAVVGGGGGRSVASADECEEAGLQVSPLPEAVRARFRELDPGMADWVSNPADGSILGGGAITMPMMLEEMIASPGYDVLIANVGEHFPLDTPQGAAQVARSTEAYVKAAQQTAKPVAVVLGHGASRFEWQREALLAAREKVVGAGVALFPSIGRAARALRRAADYWRWREEEA